MDVNEIVILDNMIFFYYQVSGDLNEEESIFISRNPNN